LLFDLIGDNVSPYGGTPKLNHSFEKRTFGAAKVSSCEGISKKKRGKAASCTLQATSFGRIKP
jgi:hypothetical protein